MRDTFPLLLKTDFPAIRRRGLETLQANLGYRCNQSCLHCHVAASPKRTEEMSWQTMSVVLEFLRRQRIRTLDLTGGAPEMNPNFRRLVVAARDLGVRVIDRCNLTILGEPGYESLADFLAEQEVEITASLPCYSEDNVDAQRGDGTFQASIDGLRKLNALGYGAPGGKLVLNLVYNPLGPTLPPDQGRLESSYKEHLATRHGVFFNHLFALANMPIRRFGSQLVAHNQFGAYMRLLKDAYRPGNLDDVMCRSLISVGWQGEVFDCDFNQMLGLHLGGGAGGVVRLAQLLNVDFADRPVRVADHCYGCTAGQGSSCGGSLSCGDETAPRSGESLAA